MPAIPVAINRLAAFLAPQASAEGRLALSGLMKCATRFGIGRGPNMREAALFLTRAEQSALFAGGRRFLLTWGGRIFLAGAVVSLVRNLIAGGDEPRSLETRLEIIQAHLVKGGSLYSAAAGVAEQVLFIVLDASGETLTDALAGALSTFDAPGLSTSLMATWFDRNDYRELAPPVQNIDRVDSIFEAYGFPLQPEYVPATELEPGNFPVGPMPSIGRRA